VRASLVVSSVVSASLLLAACGGSSPNPVSQYQPGDEERTCEGLRFEISTNENEIVKRLPGEDATGKNVALGVAGAFLLVPLFFMDFKDAERIEIDSYRRRNLWLREVAARKGCDVPEPKVKFEEKPAETAPPE